MAWYESMMQPSTVTPKSPNFDWFQRFSDIGTSVKKATDEADLKNAYAAAEKKPRGDIEALQAEKAQLAQKLTYLEGQLRVVENNEAREQRAREYIQNNAGNEAQYQQQFGMQNPIRNMGSISNPALPAAGRTAMQGYTPASATPTGLAAANMQGYTPAPFRSR